MTAAFFRGRRRRAAAAVGAVTFGLVALSACDKPTPLATLTVGSTTVTSEAACYDDGSALDKKDIPSCLKEEGKTVKASVDDTIRIGVDKKIADQGWTVVANGQGLVNPSTKTFRNIPAARLLQGAKGNKVVLSVVQADGGSVYGFWNFTIEDNS
ncbi:DUF2771 domain-containing protein [Streptomyces sp. NPDC052396]|uniref:DUF2771 domain-containing protein n=1 Tax=Streptomyces sp. NPDC052396 TaxID=3365689 RepID=UPI0037D71029